ncbi:MAG: hypothetical protein QE265_13030 [Rhodoferax sp.]|nr:hypothetical protein [Rhodoferax sp.]
MFGMKAVSGAVLCGAVLLTGCASIMNDDNQNINVTTTGNKQISGNVDGKPFTAPGVVSVKRDKVARTLNVDTPGCTKETSLPNEVDSKFWINILSGGPFGSSTDYGTGKMWKYQENVAIACQ